MKLLFYSKIFNQIERERERDDGIHRTQESQSGNRPEDRGPSGTLRGHGGLCGPQTKALSSEHRESGGEVPGAQRRPDGGTLCVPSLGGPQSAQPQNGLLFSVGKTLGPLRKALGTESSQCQQLLPQVIINSHVLPS